MSKLGPKLWSMIRAWLKKKVESWENEMERAMVDAQTGRTLTKNLNSSTWVTVQSLHRFFALASIWVCDDRCFVQKPAERVLGKDLHSPLIFCMHVFI